MPCPVESVPKEERRFEAAQLGREHGIKAHKAPLAGKQGEHILWRSTAPFARAFPRLPCGQHYVQRRLGAAGGVHEESATGHGAGWMSA